jgi:hypothetical protein
MKKGLRLVQQLDSSKKQGTRANKLSNSWGSRSIEIDSLELGLFCCDKKPELINLLVDYYTEVHSSYVTMAPWVERGIEEFKTYEISDSLKRELFVLKTMLPVDELNESIHTWFPDRKESLLSTLLMLKQCSYYVGVAISKGDNVDCYDLASETLYVMKQKLLSL